KARYRGLDARFFVGDVLTLTGFGEDAFDIVLDGFCLHCIIGEDRARYLASAWRVLKPHCLFYVIPMCNEPWPDGLKQHFDYACRCQVYGEVAVRYCGWAESILAEITEAGFEVRDWTVQSDPEHQCEDMLLVAATKWAA